MAKNKKAILATAYHEAGHAVASIILDLDFHSVSIEPDGDSLGRVCHRGFPTRISKEIDQGGDYDSMSPESLTFAEKWIRRSLAGEIAEHLFTRRHNFDGAESDRIKAIEMALAIHESIPVTEKYIDFLSQKTNELLSKPYTWHGIGVLAKELCKRKTMTGDEARKCYYSAVNDYMDRK